MPFSLEQMYNPNAGMDPRMEEIAATLKGRRGGRDARVQGMTEAMSSRDPRTWPGGIDPNRADAIQAALSQLPRVDGGRMRNPIDPIMTDLPIPPGLGPRGGMRNVTGLPGVMPMLPDEGGQAPPGLPQKPRGQMTREEWIAAKLTPGPRRPRPKTFTPEQTDWLNTLSSEDQGKYGYTPPPPPAPPPAAAPPPPPPAEGTTQNAAPPEGNQGQRVAAGASRARPRRPRARDLRNVNKPRKTRPPGNQY